MQCILNPIVAVRSYNGVSPCVGNFSGLCITYFLDRLKCSSGNNIINPLSGACKYINIVPADIKMMMIIIFNIEYRFQLHLNVYVASESCWDWFVIRK
jgi:hypothetical protein